MVAYLTWRPSILKIDAKVVTDKQLVYQNEIIDTK